MEKWELAKEIYNTSRLTGTFKLDQDKYQINTLISTYLNLIQHC